MLCCATLCYASATSPPPNRLRHEHPAIDAWFRALEQQATYRGTQSDHHTHAHDLPPQMGGCWSNNSDAARTMADQIDRGDGLGVDEARWDSDHCIDAAAIALGRVLRHRKPLMERNPQCLAMTNP